MRWVPATLFLIMCIFYFNFCLSLCVANKVRYKDMLHMFTSQVDVTLSRDFISCPSMEPIPVDKWEWLHHDNSDGTNQCVVFHVENGTAVDVPCLYGYSLLCKVLN